MADKLEELFLIGVGSALLAKEKMEKVGQDMLERREESKEKAREFFNRSLEKGSSEREEVRSMLKNLLREATSELGLATKEDIDELKRELAARTPESK